MGFLSFNRPDAIQKPEIKNEEPKVEVKKTPVKRSSKKGEDK